LAIADWRLKIDGLKIDGLAIDGRPIVDWIPKQQRLREETYQSSIANRQPV
jgi:hypothetical protein